MLTASALPDPRPDPLRARATVPTLIAVNFALAAAYYFAGSWGLHFSASIQGSTLIWMPAGIALAALLLFGPWVAPAIFIGQFCIAMSIDGWGAGGNAWSWVLTASGNVCEGLLSWYLLRHVMSFDRRIERLSDAVAIVFIAAPLAPFVGAVVAACALCATGVQPWSMFWNVAAVWYVGDAISILLLTPLIITWAIPPRPTLTRAAEGLLLALLVCATAFVAFGQKSLTRGAGYPLAFLPMPLVVWGAMRFGPRGASALSLIICIIAAWSIIQGRGPFDLNNPTESIKLLWAFCAVIAGTALCLSAAASESRQTQRTLRESKERYRLLVEGSGVIAWEVDPKTMAFSYVSAKARALLGYPLERWYAPNFWPSSIHPEDREATVVACHADIHAGRDHELEYRMLAADGRTVWIHDIVTVVAAPGKPRQIRGVMIDITDRKAAQERTAAAERKFRALFEESPYGVMIIDPQAATIVEVNAALCELLGGYDRNELEGASLSMIEALESSAQTTAHIQRVLSEGSDVFETRLRIKGGVIIEALIGVRISTIAGRQVLHSIVRDITQQKRAAAALLDSEQRFRDMFEGHDSIMLLIDQQTGAIVDANAAASEFYGYTRAELKQLKITAINQCQPDVVHQALHNAASGRQNRFDFIHRLKDGQDRYVEVHSSPLQYQGRTLLFSILFDISDRRKAEEARDRLQAQVLHAQKLESLGVMAGGVAHDFNNLLVGILGNAGLAMQCLPIDSTARPVIGVIEQAAQRAADLTRQLLAYAGKGRLVIEAIDLSAMITEMVQIMEVAIPKNVQVIFDLAPGLPAVEVDGTQVRQIAMNLLTNAADALDADTGQIRVSTGAMFASRQYLAGTYVPSDAAEGQFVYIEVADSGKGMDRATLQRIFDPFFTTKFTGRGLGLAAALGIIRGHRGAIKVESQPGRGTTIRLLFPASAITTPLQIIEPKPRPRRETAPHSGCVLVVDDEKLVRDLAGASLRAAGYTVLEAADGARALDILREKSTDIIAVLLDLTMPRMSGAELMWAMREIGVTTPVVLSSGYAAQEALDRLGEVGPAGFIQKPYTPDILVAEIERVCAAAPRPAHTPERK